MCCWGQWLKARRRGATNEYPQRTILLRIRQTAQNYHWIFLSNESFTIIIVSIIIIIICSAQSGIVCSGIYGQRRPRSAYASAQFDQDLPWPLTESLDTTEYMHGEQRPRWYLRMRRMIWICVFCICSKALFRLTRPILLSHCQSNWNKRRSFFILFLSFSVGAENSSAQSDHNPVVQI